jgi:hypothetical protein
MAPQNMVVRCANAGCDFTRDRPLPVLTVDEAIYRRLPAFLIATVDKFAGLPWVGEAGAFFGHVDRQDEWGFYGAAEPGRGKPLWNGQSLAPPDLIIQDELHLISGPLGTVAALYEIALDQLATRTFMGKRLRPKVVASTATVRRAQEQVKALFDREGTAIFPPPGPDRRDSYFALTVPPEQKPGRLYVGLASPGRGPKLIFLRVLTTLLAAAHAEAALGADADAYETALCYFNALRELGGARRIVEDEVRVRLAAYGAERRRLKPVGAPFADRRLREPLELTSRVSTDQVAEALVHSPDRGRGAPAPAMLGDHAVVAHGFRVSARQHLVQDRDAYGCLGLLGGEFTRSQPRSDQGLISPHRCFDQRALAIICCFLPG